MSDKPPITIFDMQTLPLLFQIIKAMIPFLDFPMAKMLSVIIRLNELNYTINIMFVNHLIFGRVNQAALNIRHIISAVKNP